MNAEILMRLESCNGDPTKLRATLHECIAAAGVYPNEQYLVVLEYLYKNTNHPSAEDVYCALNPYYPELSRSRINTILDILSRAGVIKTVRLDQYNSFFDGNSSTHPHFICTKCGEVTDMEMIRNVDFRAGVPKGAVVSEVMLNYIGICPACIAKEAN